MDFDGVLAFFLIGERGGNALLALSDSLAGFLGSESLRPSVIWTVVLLCLDGRNYGLKIIFCLSANN